MFRCVSKLLIGGPSGAAGQKNIDEMVPYTGKEVYNYLIMLKCLLQTFCFICHEKLEVVQDDEDESWYFVASKRIKINSSKEGGKKTVIIHIECLKQIEMSREQTRTRSNQQNGTAETQSSLLGKRQPSDIIYESKEGENNNTISDITMQPQKEKDNLAKLIRGMNNYKRHFIG